MNSRTEPVRRFAARAVLALCLAAGVVVGLYLLIHLAQALLLVFAGVLLGVALDGGTTWISRRAHLPRSASLGLVALFVGLLSAAGVWLAGPHIVDQATRLDESIPTAVESVKSSIMEIGWLRRVLEGFPSVEEVVSSGSGLMGRITGVFSSALGVIVGALFVLFLGIFIALDPRPYVSGVLHLVPSDRRERAREVLTRLGTALRWWLLGRLASMTVVGILTVVGLLIVQVPLAFILGLLAALLSFVPIVGPVVSAIPAILIGFVDSPLTALYVVIVYVVVQLLESNVVTPLIQKEAVSLPPAALLTAQALMAVVFGWMGILLSTPLAVCLIILVQMLYVEDVVGDHIAILGEHASQGG